MFVLCFFPLFKNTPFALPGAKVKSCRASAFASSTYIINEKCRFYHDLLLFYIYSFLLLLFLEKTVIQKTPKKKFHSLFSLSSIPKVCIYFFTKINHNSYAD